MSAPEAGPVPPRVLAGLALDGVGASGSGGGDELSAAARSAETLGFDVVSLDDSPDRRPAGGALLSPVDALAFLARRTRRVGLLATARSHYAEPFHVAKEIATLDFVSAGRAGLLVRPGSDSFGDALHPSSASLDAVELAEQAAEFVAVVGELWDSWEDGAELREVASGRYVDNSRVHHIDHDGRWFRVKGPLITPRPPQGAPPVFVADGDGASAARLADTGGVPGHQLAGTALERVEVNEGAQIVGTVREAALRLQSGSGAHTLLLLFAVSPDSLPRVLQELGDELARTGDSLPGASAAEGAGFAQRLGLRRRPSRYAATAEGVIG
ncbi:LLM class flavin-dependent oxidoreductase [Herbiconiux sp. 11R-BC]|uniref:LLM class flavin-dependent oxidoreductase n=1 Tax=Herbiconiux sp. 11R-BC TaxID=3111637 RepID=UPI003C0EFEFA